jgi:hypothetical protein
MAADNAKYRFDKTLTELQAGLKILPVGVAAAGAWHYAFIYDIVARHYPDLQERARPISRKQAQKTLMLRHLENVVAVTRDEMFRVLDVLGWTKQEFAMALQCLIEEGAVREMQMQEAKEPLLVVYSE